MKPVLKNREYNKTIKLNNLDTKTSGVLYKVF